MSLTISRVGPEMALTIGMAASAALSGVVHDVRNARGLGDDDRCGRYGGRRPPTEENLVNIRVRLDELLPTKTAARSLPQAINRLETGDAEQLILTTRNAPRAVLITVERYEQLLTRSRGDEPLAA